MTRTQLAITALAAALTGCSAGPEPSTGIVAPAAGLTKVCSPLPAIPAKDGDPKVRAGYYATTRQMYGDCADRHRGLVAWSREVVK